MAEQTGDASWLNCRLPQTPMGEEERQALVKKYRPAARQLQPCSCCKPRVLRYKAIEAKYGHLF